MFTHSNVLHIVVRFVFMPINRSPSCIPQDFTVSGSLLDQSGSLLDHLGSVYLSASLRSLLGILHHPAASSLLSAKRTEARRQLTEAEQPGTPKGSRGNLDRLRFDTRQPPALPPRPKRPKPLSGPTGSVCATSVYSPNQSLHHRVVSGWFPGVC